ncbi:PLP-dependent aminotransferase family protein [Streptomyces sp. SCA3-4]|uniref:MocR-like pyridoxine biosynthesis transcription factor PdxR n=1 Tax=Streptomyces sichuanensis TaxID=2871810 RepID=UPI001CE284AB|nr:PLP-dependent aminotransferase family protein [Streptomyces sichuanensis]MCA6092977.1 PLP-dependent aminotransferase family protein [Streptomyces sichuanensis]
MERTWAIDDAAARAATPVDAPAPPDADAAADVPAVLGADLHLDLAGGAGARGVRAALTRSLREAVRSGRLTPGTRLPSSRSLAADLGLARNTVADAYGELVAEGWLTARQGSGTRVARRTAPTPRRPAARSAALPPTPVRPLHDLRPGHADVSVFPRAAWLAAVRRALAAAPHEAFGYGDGRGRPELRTALAGYLARARGVRADPERIVVCAGFTQGLALLGRALLRRGVREMGVESHGLWVHHGIVEDTGLRPRPLTLDHHGAVVAELDAWRNVGAALLTPAHQFPTGVPLHPDRRADVVAWAARTGAVVIEDDYDGEFRYDRQPVGALQGLAPENVVYCGTASKALAPGVRLGWLVLPDHLLGDVLELKRPGEYGLSALDQLTLADFIETGAYDRHVRSMRLRYRRRRDQLVAALAERAPHVRVTGIAAGLHAVLELPQGTERTTVQAAAWQSLALEGLDRFRHPAAPAGAPAPGTSTGDGLLVAYGTPPEHAFPGALEALLSVLPPAD